MVISMDQYNFQFKKQYGQNFIKEDNIVTKIVSIADIPAQSLIIEIGPGSGMLTKKLAETGNTVLCYEIDNRLEEILSRELGSYSNVHIIFDDFLNRDLVDDLKDFSYEHLFVVANLPYYITTPIIMRIIESQLFVDKIVVMVQKEVGDRFSAQPNSRDYSSLTVYLNYYFTIKKEFIVSRNSFVPKPNVDSIVISLTKKEQLLSVLDLSFFFQFVRDAFHFKRKNLRNNLKNYNLSLLEAGLKTIHKDLTSRAEQLSIEEFVQLSNYYCQNKK